MRTTGRRSGREPVYVISIAARLAGVHPQTLRIYERKRLIRPHRTAGSQRLYSENDVERLRLIQTLTQEFGINLAGVAKIFDMTDELEELQEMVSELRDQIAAMETQLARETETERRRGFELVPIRRGEIVRIVR